MSKSFVYYNNFIGKPDIVKPKHFVKSCLDDILSDKYESRVLSNNNNNNKISVINVIKPIVFKNDIKQILNCNDYIIDNDNITEITTITNKKEENKIITNESIIKTDSYDDSILPNFEYEFTQLDMPIDLVGNENTQNKQINRFAARRLMDHQVVGVKWLWNKYINREGAILGDSMGMGKTIQITTLLLAIYNKTGNKVIDKRIMNSYNRDYKTNQSIYDNINKETNCYLPSLVIAPASVLDNWQRELKTWGKFNICILKDDDYINDYESLLEYIYLNRLELIILSYHMLNKFISLLNTIKWNIIVYDEGHELRNIKTKKYEQIVTLKYAYMRVICTGTPIQNNIDDIWSLINIITNQTFMSKSLFIEYYTKPILRYNSRNATPIEITVGKSRLDELTNNIVNKYIIQRNKDILLSLNLLKGKQDIVILCNLSTLQSQLYQQLLSLPDFINLRNYFNKDENILPVDINNKIDSKAVIWKQLHEDNEPCKRCPLCVLYPCLMKLLQVASHPMLLQCVDINSSNYYKTKQFLTNCLSLDLLNDLSGVVRLNHFDYHHYIENSGKMIILDKLLTNLINMNNNKVLIFVSQNSIQMLDIIEVYIKHKQWLYRRLDGSTPTDKRQELIDEFNNNINISVFLLSSKAGGLGINLKSASKVVIYDTNWNPTVDQQSQDRAYRIGQMNQVTIYRLVSKGTIEEMKYMRQIYKQEISNIVLQDHIIDRIDDDITTTNPNTSISMNKPNNRKAKSTNKSNNPSVKKFEAIMGEVKGELFGIENLLQYNQQSILKLLRHKYDDNTNKSSSDVTIHKNDEGMDMDMIKTDDIIESINKYIEENKQVDNDNKLDSSENKISSNKVISDELDLSNESTNTPIDKSVIISNPMFNDFNNNKSNNNEIIDNNLYVNNNNTSNITTTPSNNYKLVEDLTTMNKDSNNPSSKKRVLPFHNNVISTNIKIVKPNYNNNSSHI